MKKIICLILLCTALMCSCEKSVEENSAPSCQITSPEDGAAIEANTPLLIKGTGSDPENNIASVSLKLNGEVIPAITEVPFQHTVPADGLKSGANIIILQVKDSEGLSAEHTVTVTVGEAAKLQISPDSFEFGYSTEEEEMTITADSNWSIRIPTSSGITFYNESTESWEETTMYTGTGTKTLRLKCTASNIFTENESTLTVTAAGTSLPVTINQAASPDMMLLLEDEMLRMAAQISMIMYDVDKNMDGKLSAWELEQEPEEGAPYGIDAGQWDVKSAKGIEHFPYLRHLDLNSNPQLSEIDLSKNPNLLSIHVQGCTALTALDLTKTPKLIELGCDHALYTKLDLTPFKSQLHTLAVLNRKGGSSIINVSGYTNLSRLYVYGNGLTELNISGCTGLWLLSAGGNNFSELDLSQVDRDKDNMYTMTECPNLTKVYVWKGFTKNYYSLFSIDPNVQIIEK